MDLVNIVTRYSPLGPLVWAATGKEPNLAPPRIIRDIRGIAFGYSDEEIVAVRMEGESPMTRDVLRGVLGPALDKAYEYCDEVAPIESSGCLFVNADEAPVQAADEAIAKGTARALSIRDFGITPVVG